MDTLVIKDLDSAIDALIASYRNDFDIKEVAYSDGLNLQIRLEGKQWDGTIDYAIAEFVIDLQKELLRLYNRHNQTSLKYLPSSIEANNLKVKVKISNGSTLLDINITEVLSKMDSQHMFYGVLVCAAVWGIVKAAEFYKDYKINNSNNLKDERVKKIEADREVQLKKLDAVQNTETAKQIKEQINKSFDVVQNSLEVMHGITKSMHKDDKITFNDSVQLPAEYAKQIYKRKPRLLADEEENEERFFVDDRYVVYQIDRVKDTCTILLGSKKRKVSLAFLSENERALFYAECAKGKGENLQPILLQVSVILKSGVYISGFIQKINARPREKTVSYEEAVSKSIENAEKDFENDE